MSRKQLKALCLSLALVIAQFGAIAHVHGHDAAKRHSDTRPVAHVSQCLQCAAYGVVLTVGGGKPPAGTIALRSCPGEMDAIQVFQRLPESIHYFQSRGPPANPEHV